jgi:hypothetical protein
MKIGTLACGLLQWKDTTIVAGWFFVAVACFCFLIFSSNT